MKKLVVLSLVLFSVSAFSQSNQSQFDGIGDEVVGRIRNLESSFSYKVNEASANFPEYEKALGKTLARVENSVIGFQKAIEKEKQELAAKVGREVSEYNAIKSLSDRDPSNVAFQKLLVDKKERLDIALNTAKSVFTQNYKSFVREFLLTFPVESLIFDMKYISKSSNTYYRSDNSSTFNLFNMLGEQSKLSTVIFTEKKERKEKYEDYMEKVLKDEFIEKQLTGQMRVYETTINGRSSLFDDCKTAGCVYLLNEQIKSWHLSLQKEDLSLSFHRGVLDLDIKNKGITASAKRIQLVFDHVGSLKAKTLPIAEISNSN